MTAVLKLKPFELKGWLSQFWKAERPMMLFYMFGLFILGRKKLNQFNVKNNNS